MKLEGVNYFLYVHVETSRNDTLFTKSDTLVVLIYVNIKNRNKDDKFLWCIIKIKSTTFK